MAEVDPVHIADDYKTVLVSLAEGEKALSATWHWPNGAVATVLSESPSLVEFWHHTTMPGGKLKTAGHSEPPGVVRQRSLGGVDIEEARTIRDVGVAAIAPSANLRNFFGLAGKGVLKQISERKTADAWNNAFSNPDGSPIRLVFQLRRQNAVSLSAIPLEALCCDDPGTWVNVQDHFVASPRRVSIVRYVEEGEASQQRDLDVTLPLQLLVVASSPTDLLPDRRLNVENEMRGIREAVNRLGAERARLVELPPGRATFKQISRSLQSCHILHFMGHGDVVDGELHLLLEDDQRKSDLRPAADLTNLLLDSGVRLIVLNGCRTAAIPALASQFPAVIGMQFSISDEAACRFSLGLYEELLERGQLDDAVWKGRQAIREEGSAQSQAEFCVPALYMRRGNGLLMRIPPQIRTVRLPDARCGDNYKVTLNARGGRRPYVWRINGLPPGLTMAADSGEICGQPTASGEFSVAVSVASRDGLQTENALRLTVMGSDLRIITDKIV